MKTKKATKNKNPEGSCKGTAIPYEQKWWLLIKEIECFKDMQILKY